jgi:DNA-binding CsgD family transcriptional regulator
MHPIDWNSLRTENDIQAVAGEYFEEIGISGGAFAYTPIGILPSGRPGLLRRALAINLEQKMIEQWFESPDDISGRAGSVLSQSFDPVRRRMSQRVLPEWIVLEDFLADSTAITNVVAAKWIKTLIRRGIRESFHVPVFTGRGEYWSLAAMRFDDNPNTGPLGEDVLCQLHWMAVNFAAICIDRLGWRSEKPEYVKHPLTRRELECLYWAAQGHSTIETAEILEIQNETVRQYIKQSLKKLNARNKTQAIWLAHRLGYLALS